MLRDPGTATSPNNHRRTKVASGKSTPAQVPSTVLAGIASGPREPKPRRRRAPKGTFDRTAYQRELMRKRRAEGKA